MYDVIKTKTATEQIDNIADYIVSEFANVDAAIDFLLDVEDALDVIARHPRIGKKYESDTNLDRTYRIKLVKNCKLFYTVDDDKKEIYIACIFHDLQNIDESML